MGVQRVHQCRPFLDDPHPRVAMAVDPTLMPLGQAEPALQIEIVVDLIEGVTASKEAGTEAPATITHIERIRALEEENARLRRRVAELEGY